MKIEDQNIQLALEGVRELIDKQVYAPDAINGYARACGTLQGVLEGMIKHVPEAREYFVKYHTHFNKEN